MLVYDLGGGTFDVTLLRLAAGKVQTLATDGDVQLGGHDWDQRLVDYAAECFLKTHQLDPRQDPAALNRLYLDAMEAKHTLSARSRAVIQINYQGRFAEAPSPASSSKRCRPICWNALPTPRGNCWAWPAWNGKTCSGCCWWAVRRGCRWSPACCKAFPAFSPIASVNPDEAVARGAALYASHLLTTRAGGPRSTFQVTNVNAHSLGVEGIDTDTLRKKNVVLIPRNTPLPARNTDRFATKSEGQRSIVIKVLEGESSQPGDCIAIGRTVVRDLPVGLPKGWPVEVTFEYGANGRLAVDALVPGTQHQARLELVRETGLSNEGLTRWKQPVSEAGGFNTFESAAQDVLTRAAVTRVLAQWNRVGDRLGPARAEPPARDRGSADAAAAVRPLHPLPRNAGPQVRSR